MKTYQVMTLFAEQLKRISNGKTYKTKFVVTPSSVKEAGIIFKVSLVKTRLGTSCPAMKRTRDIKIRLSVCGTAESMTGLEQACEAIETLDDFFEQSDLRLEEVIESANGMQVIRKIPNTRISQNVSPEDSFIDNPDSTDVQDVEDTRLVTITIPQE